MFKKVSLLLAIMMVASLALAACQPAAPAAEEPEMKFQGLPSHRYRWY